MPGKLLKRGDVVACGGRYFVVWNPIPEAIEAFPVLLGSQASAADHVVVAGDELASWNISELTAAVCVEVSCFLPPLPTLRIIRVGRCSGGLICRVVIAAIRCFAEQKAAAKRGAELDNNGPAARDSAAA